MPLWADGPVKVMSYCCSWSGTSSNVNRFVVEPSPALLELEASVLGTTAVGSDTVTATAENAAVKGAAALPAESAAEISRRYAWPGTSEAVPVAYPVAAEYELGTVVVV